MQALNHGYYLALSKGQQGESVIQRGARGNIFLQDKEGNFITLATDSKASFVFLSPPEVKDKEHTAQVLSAMLKLPEDAILLKAGKENSLYEVLKKSLSQKEEQEISNAKLPGVYGGEETVRMYPQKEFASHTLGFVNQEGKGQYGIEEYYNTELVGSSGVKARGANPATYLRSLFQTNVKDGSHIILTLDFNIQSLAESLLKHATESLGIEEGTIIVMDPRSGKILTLANTPGFNPNEYGGQGNPFLFQNPAVQKIFEPGSVFKPVTMAAALQEKKVTPETTYEDKGILKIGGSSIENYDKRVWGKKTMREVLEFSINTGAVFAKEQLGDDKFLEYVEKFGIFEPTGIDLPGEAYSQNRELRQGREINLATAAFGQGVEMTSLQLVRAFTAFANQGRMAYPFLITDKGKQQDQVLSAETATTITSMLVSVIDQGYSKKARIPGYYIAGKTGTAQISWSALGIKKAGYSDKTVQSFMGYAPAYNPQFLILVKLQNPQTKTAEYSALPIFHELAKYIIDYLAIPPDYEVE
ncbi:MAG: cell division protein FtsI (penicillin-binding protein 3) [Parcubacteria group bacterium Greene0416_39]|nr:MAG: cell division protein FtsI (penicillin-binding protein 3) [Parcubacteria group bacterium Greene0416_39]